MEIRIGGTKQICRRSRVNEDMNASDDERMHHVQNKKLQQNNHEGLNAEEWNNNN